MVRSAQLQSALPLLSEITRPRAFVTRQWYSVGQPGLSKEAHLYASANWLSSPVSQSEGGATSRSSVLKGMKSETRTSCVWGSKHTHTHTHTHTRTHARTHARTHTHAHIHTQISGRQWTLDDRATSDVTVQGRKTCHKKRWKCFETQMQCNSRCHQSFNYKNKIRMTQKSALKH